jgi:hypothetical protein
MAKKGNRSKDTNAMHKKFERMEQDRDRAAKKAAKLLKKAEAGIPGPESIPE